MSTTPCSSLKIFLGRFHGNTVTVRAGAKASVFIVKHRLR